MFQALRSTRIFARAGERPVFILGVGAQKGGTSWLHAYLHGRPDCNMGFGKEYHVFDALWIPELRPFLHTRIAQTMKLLDAWRGADGETSPKQRRDLTAQLTLMRFYLETKTAYPAYFRSCVESSSRVRMTGDITPSYSALSAQQLRDIRRLLEKAGFAVKPVFLMREPVERIFSACKMTARNKAAQGEIRDPAKMFAHVYKDSKTEMRGRYDLTLAALDQAFGSNGVFYGFYETLFCEQEIRRLTDFLGAPYIAPDFGRWVNESKSETVLPEDLALDARRHYDSAYRACMDRFGEDFIRRIWRWA